MDLDLLVAKQGKVLRNKRLGCSVDVNALMMVREWADKKRRLQSRYPLQMPSGLG